MHPDHDLGPSLHTCLSNSLAYETLYMGRHSSRLWNEFTSSLLEKEIVSYRPPSSLSSFLLSSRENFSHETYLVRFVANPKSFRIHPKFCPSFSLSITEREREKERERIESWNREMFFNWYYVAIRNVVQVNHKYLTICSFNERMIHKRKVFCSSSLFFFFLFGEELGE